MGWDCWDYDPLSLCLNFLCGWWSMMCLIWLCLGLIFRLEYDCYCCISDSELGDGLGSQLKYTLTVKSTTVLENMILSMVLIFHFPTFTRVHSWGKSCGDFFPIPLVVSFILLWFLFWLPYQKWKVIFNFWLKVNIDRASILPAACSIGEIIWSQEEEEEKVNFSVCSEKNKKKRRDVTVNIYKLVDV